jgi:hypothetical protein
MHCRSLARARCLASDLCAPLAQDVVEEFIGRVVGDTVKVKEKLAEMFRLIYLHHRPTSTRSTLHQSTCILRGMFTPLGLFQDASCPDLKCNRPRCFFSHTAKPKPASSNAQAGPSRQPPPITKSAPVRKVKDDGVTEQASPVKKARIELSKASSPKKPAPASDATLTSKSATVPQARGRPPIRPPPPQPAAPAVGPCNLSYS